MNVFGGTGVTFKNFGGGVANFNSSTGQSGQGGYSSVPSWLQNSPYWNSYNPQEKSMVNQTYAAGGQLQGVSAPQQQNSQTGSPDTTQAGAILNGLNQQGGQPADPNPNPGQTWQYSGAVPVQALGGSQSGVTNVNGVPMYWNGNPNSQPVPADWLHMQYNPGTTQQPTQTAAPAQTTQQAAPVTMASIMQSMKACDSSCREGR
jgi:hypothetical protein